MTASVGSFVPPAAAIALQPVDKTVRADIQALRGLAILLVMLHHARLIDALKGGYLGVDIFFVVSGYLITGIIKRELEAGSFTFKAFYWRRAKRLLPAAYLTFGATALVAPLFLTRPEQLDHAWQLLGAVTFTGNLVLWVQTGYFEAAAQLKPLLHVWSLAIEEQYYLLLPAALVLTPRRFWAGGTILLVMCSLFLCLALGPIKPGATFYLLPTRVWELGLGSLGALVLETWSRGAWPIRLFWPALVSLVAIPLSPVSEMHPGVDALIVCIATLIVISRQHPVFLKSTAAHAFGWLGDRSYSLYLVHWPLLSFAAHAWVSPVPAPVRAMLLLVAVVLAAVMYTWIEMPARRTELPITLRTTTRVLATSTAIAAMGFIVYHLDSSHGAIDYAHIRRANLGLGEACEFGSAFEAKPDCRTADSPRILVWGDSYAMHLVPGIANTTSHGLVQATKTTCGPLAGISSYRQHAHYNRAWAEDCVKFNESVFTYLAATPSIEVVVMSSLYGQYLSGRVVVSPEGSTMSGSPVELVEKAGSEALAATSLARSIRAVRALGKRVVLVAPPPSTGDVDLGRCLERLSTGKATMGADSSSCAMSEMRHLERHLGVRSLLDRVANETKTAVFHFDEHLCKAGTCAVELDGTFLYRDNGHFSHDGSRLIGKKLSFGALLDSLAR